MIFENKNKPLVWYLKVMSRSIPENAQWETSTQNLETIRDNDFDGRQ